MEGDLLFAGSEQSFLISIHSLRMEGDSPCQSAIFASSISIHSLRMEGDATAAETKREPEKFQSTPSAWRETQLGDQMSAYIAFQSTPSVWRETLLAVSIELISDISIHSLRMEGDPVDL